MIFLAILLASVPFQDAGDGASEWLRVDRVVYQAGDEMITMSDVIVFYETTRRRLNLPITTPEQREEALDRSLESLILLRLEAQAGEDQHHGGAEVDRLIDRYLESQIRDTGLVEYVDRLEQSGVSALRERERTKSGYFTSSFRNLGLQGERPTRDHFIRPGELREFYRVRSMPTPFRFRELLLRVVQVGTVEDARSLSEQLRERLLAGEDFTALHDEYGTTYADSKGATELFLLSDLTDPRVRIFGETAAVGAISEVMPLAGPEGVVAFRILELYHRDAPPARPPFHDSVLQGTLRMNARDAREEVWLNLARVRLRGQAYLWPPPQAAQRPPGKGGSTPPSQSR